jgi:hypothetical protein
MLGRPMIAAQTSASAKVPRRAEGNDIHADHYTKGALVCAIGKPVSHRARTPRFSAAQHSLQSRPEEHAILMPAIAPRVRPAKNNFEQNRHEVGGTRLAFTCTPSFAKLLVQTESSSSRHSWRGLDCSFTLPVVVGFWLVCAGC